MPKRGPSDDDALLALLFDCVGDATVLSAKRMFGGHGVYGNGVFFAIRAGDALYFKTSSASRPDFEAEGMSPFSYVRQGRTTYLSTYYQVPDRLFDEPEDLRDWVMRAIKDART